MVRGEREAPKVVTSADESLGFRDYCSEPRSEIQGQDSVQFDQCTVPAEHPTWACNIRAAINLYIFSPCFSTLVPTLECIDAPCPVLASAILDRYMHLRDNLLP